MTKKLTTIIVILILIVLAMGAAYWYFLFRVPGGAEPANTPATNQDPTGFSPFDRTPTGSPSQNGTDTQQPLATSTPTISTTGTPTNIPVLRLLSAAPVGGYGISASSTATVVRWVNRGRGNVYETLTDTPTITTLSNTLVPRIYESWWNKDISTFVAQYISDDSDAVTTVIANLIKNPPSAPPAVNASGTQATTVSETPYQLKGKIISGNMIAVAVSPKKDRILTVTNSNGRAVGHTSNFDGSKQVQVFTLPMTQISVDWPEDNTVAITTRGSASYAGFLYFLNIKTGVIKEIIGNIPGLSTQVSKDATKVFYSYAGTGNERISNAILDVKSGEISTVIVRTLADKCVWSSKFKEDIYCAVPSQIPAGIYPDDWYLGKTSFVDTIWLIDSNTGQAQQIANLLNQGNTLIDAYNTKLDLNDEYLFFVNKNNLSFWSLDLVSSN